MSDAAPLKSMLKHGALVAAANWPVVLIQFIAESTFKLLVAVPVVGGAVLVALVLGGVLRQLLDGVAREILPSVAAALGDRPGALAGFGEIFQSTGFQGRKGSLLSVVDQTRTAMGGRMLQQWLRYPLLDLDRIAARQQAVAELVEHAAIRAEISSRLDEINDIERLNGRNTRLSRTPGTLWP